jgi:N-acetylmuramoyl-L-alanine amidase
VIDGSEVFNLPAPPIILNDRTLVPVREVFERVGGTIGWHSGHRQVSLFYGDDVLVMTIDYNTANLNGSLIEMDIPPIIHNDRTMVPLRFPAEVFGFDVDWDADERAAIVNSAGSVSTAPEEQNEILNGIPIIPLPLPEGNTNEPPAPLEEEYEEYEEYDKTELPWDSVIEGSTISENPARDVSITAIQAIPHPQTTITELRTPAETGTAAFVAVASLPISEVRHFLLPDNRLVVDIHNAVSLISGEFGAIENIPVTSFRASQFSQTPRITRIVFDVIGSAEYSISLSADRTLLTVSFSQNRISGVFSQSDGFSDSLFIQGDVLPSISISTEGFPHYITINIDNAVMDTNGGLVNGVFASNFSVGQAEGHAYVRVYIHNEWPSFSIAHSTNSVAFMMHKGISGVRYDSVNRELRISKDFFMDINNLQSINDYLRCNYTFVLPASAEVLGRGEISILDGFINSVTLGRDTAGNVHLTFNTARILRFSVHEETDYYVIRAHLPRDVSPFIVVIDPGHGGSAPGTSHNGIVEKELVLIVSHMVMQLLDADPFITAFMTRNSDADVSLLGRAEFANNLGADLFVSIHANAAELRRGVINPDVNGIETWYTIGTLEEEGDYDIDSRQLATILQRNMVSGTGANNRGLRNAPNFVVLYETKMPSVLLELGFLTNAAEAAKLGDTQYQWTLANAIYKGIVEAFAVHTPAR